MVFGPQLKRIRYPEKSERGAQPPEMGFATTAAKYVVYWPQVPHFRTRSKVRAKQRVQELLDRLPDDCSLDDVLYHLYVLQAIDRGLADAEAGRMLSHQDVARELRKKWLADAAG